MQLRKCGALPSATKDINTSSSQEGRKVRSDSVQQPYVQEHANETGASIPQPIDYTSPWVDIINNVLSVGGD